MIKISINNYNIFKFIGSSRKVARKVSKLWQLYFKKQAYWTLQHSTNLVYYTTKKVLVGSCTHLFQVIRRHDRKAHCVRTVHWKFLFVCGEENDNEPNITIVFIEPRDNFKTLTTFCNNVVLASLEYSLISRFIYFCRPLPKDKIALVSTQYHIVDCLHLVNLTETIELAALGKPKFTWVQKRQCSCKMYWIHDRRCWCVILSLCLVVGILLYFVDP